MTNQELVTKIIEICGEIEAELFNDRFGQYRPKVAKQLTKQAKQLIGELQKRDFDMEAEAETNEEFDYALQFI